MKLLISSCARLFKDDDGCYYTPIVYDYSFYERYLRIFEEICVVGFCEKISNNQKNTLLKVSGPRLSVFEVPFPHGEWDYIRKRRLIIKSLKNCCDNCDAALLRVPETLCFLIMDVLIEKKIPWAVEVVADPINLYTRQSCTSKYRLIYKYWYYWLQKRACYLANGTSYVTKNELQKRYPPKVSINNFTTNYTDTNIKISKDEKARKLSKNRRIRLIHVATYLNGYAKGHKETIEAFISLLKDKIDVELTLIGNGSLLPDVLNIINFHNCSNRINYTGKIPFNSVIEELRKADIFVFPSYNEGLPRVVIEAMSVGLPIVASDIPAHRELLSPCYLVPVRNSHEIYVKIKQLILSSNEYILASQDNLERAKNYDIDIIQDKRDEFYQNLKNLAMLNKK